jgi:hypothetical protein
MSIMEIPSLVKGLAMRDSSVWCLIEIDRGQVNARIMHIGRGRFKVIEDKSDNTFVNRIIDASDIIHCRIE